jgi:acetylornithine deacetylase/succinyl-diaminopimelate desuccinylase-like protein
MSEQPGPVDLLANLIRFDTTNPPGNEGPCIAYLEDVLRREGVSTRRIAKDPGRPNLLAHLPGRGVAPPLLLYGHVDVVTAGSQDWTHPPFAGSVENGWVWGRGALDMKAGVAMMVSAVVRAASERHAPPGDVLLLCLADEEAGGRFGARFLAEEHPDLFAGVRFALGEFGGFPLLIVSTPSRSPRSNHAGRRWQSADAPATGPGRCEGAPRPASDGSSVPSIGRGSPSTSRRSSAA